MSRDNVPALGSPIVYNITLATSGVEQSQDLFISIPTGSSYGPTIKALQIRSRDAKDLQYGFITSGPYSTIPSGQTYWRDNLDVVALTVYLVGTLNGQIIEIEVWV